MLLQPLKFKFKKNRRTLLKKKAASALEFGSIGLQAVEAGVLTSKDFFSFRLILTRYLKKSAKIWFRVFPHLPVTKKPNETRMGKGKGAVFQWVASVPKGQVFLEVACFSRLTAFRALKAVLVKSRVRGKLVVKTR